MRVLYTYIYIYMYMWPFWFKAKLWPSLEYEIIEVAMPVREVCQRNGCPYHHRRNAFDWWQRFCCHACRLGDVNHDPTCSGRGQPVCGIQRPSPSEVASASAPAAVAVVAPIEAPAAAIAETDVASAALRHLQHACRLHQGQWPWFKLPSPWCRRERTVLDIVNWYVARFNSYLILTAIVRAS